MTAAEANEERHPASVDLGVVRSSIGHFTPELPNNSKINMECPADRHRTRAITIGLRCPLRWCPRAGEDTG
ncbi:hypothetical protein E1262_01010 [Jiangella aurantiaca]|uniref:Uncharacterized protein n=1 Tax=Jiangella aurantiaca TaxID=2530373 RepID=A0A4V2YTE3_9ACTN|nr:hypothetical protein [Jiangella aurantiaca]TDD73097.1 hypothetical protein E1262_01010 [Jiangella aurantiaca]